MNYKTAIVPIVSVICLGVATITGHQITASLQDEITSIGGAVIGCAVSVWGIVHNHTKG